MHKYLLATFLFIVPISPLAAQIDITTKSLPGGSLNDPYVAQLYSGGQTPWQWSVVSGSGSLPPGLALSSSGAITGVPTSVGTYAFTVNVSDNTKATGQQALSITIAAITLTTFYLPTSTFAMAYAVQLTASGGSGGPYQWSMQTVEPSPNGTLPGGLTLSESGLISGTPNSSQTPYTFDLIAYDPVTQQSSLPKMFVLAVTSCDQTISPTVAPDGEVGLPYSVSFHSNGCVYPAGNFYATDSLYLPPGLTLSQQGNLTGIPLIAGQFNAALNYGNAIIIGEVPLSITIAPPPSITSPSTLPVATLGAPYTPFQFVFAGGTPPYMLSLAGLPPGFATSGSGVLSGTPTAAGTFSFGVGLIDSLGGKSQPYPQNFQITVTPAMPLLQVPLSTLAFTAAVGGDAPPSQTIDVTPAQGAPLPDNFQVLADGGPNTPAPWLSVNATSASAPTHLIVSVDQANLATGDYSGRIQTVDSSGIHSVVPVTLTVTNANPQLAAAPAILRFTALADTPGAFVQNVLLTNVGGGGAQAFSASVAGASSWISSVTPSSGQTTPNKPVVLQVQISTQGLSTGSYHDIIHIASPAGNVELPITVFVAPSGSIVGTNTNAVLFQSVQGQSPLLVHNIEVLNTGDTSATVNWTAEVVTGSNWLRLTPSSGTATVFSPGTFTLTLAPGAEQLAPSLYYALIKISDPSSLNALQYVTAMLNVEDSSVASVPDFAPAGLFFTVATGGTAPPAHQVQINSGSVSELQVATSTADNGNWLTAQLSSDTISVSANPSGLATGIYSGNVTISANALLRSVDVTFIVEPATVFSGNCTPANLALNESGIGDDFSLVAGLPAVLNVELKSDCGGPVTNGDVVATFSNGDAPLSLVGDALGNYSATWQPGAVSSQVVVTLNATAASLQPAVAQLYGVIEQNQTPPPTLAPGGTLNNLNPVVGAPLAPGTIAQVYGTGLAASPVSSRVLPLPTTVDNTFVLVGPTQAPLYYLSSGQINIQIPYEATATQQLPIVLSVNNALTLPSTIDIVPVTPGVASYNGGQLIAQHSDFTLVTSASPAKPGEYLVIYLVGLGATNPPVASGMPAPSSTLATVTVTPTVTVGSQPATVLFAGLTPGFVGLYQVNFQVPAGAASGNDTVVVAQNGVAGNSTTLPVSQ